MEPARHTLRKLVAEVLNRLPAEQVPVEAWPFVCGKRVAQRTQAVNFAGGVLRVEVPDADWRTQLQGLSGNYVASLNQFSETRVERIDFVFAGGSAPPSTQPPRSPQAPRNGKWRRQR